MSFFAPPRMLLAELLPERFTAFVTTEASIVLALTVVFVVLLKRLETIALVVPWYKMPPVRVLSPSESVKVRFFEDMPSTVSEFLSSTLRTRFLPLTEASAIAASSILIVSLDAVKLLIMSLPAL